MVQAVRHFLARESSRQWSFLASKPPIEDLLCETLASKNDEALFYPGV
jgi:hypothetical protein